MNWFLLLLILKLFTTNWSAPIDLVEIKDEFQQDKEILDNLINKGFAVADEANNLFTTSETLINGTVSAFNSSSLNGALNENFNKIKEDLQNFSSEVQKELEQYPIKEERFEFNLPNEESNAQVTEIISFEESPAKEEIKNEEITMLTQNPAEISIDRKEEILQDFSNSSNDSNVQGDAELRSNTPIEAKENTESIVENLDNQSQQQEFSSVAEQSVSLNTNTDNVNNISDASAPLLQEEKVEEVLNASSTIENINGQNPELLLASQSQNAAPQTLNEETTNLYQQESSSEMSALKETVDTLADGMINVASMIQVAAENSNNTDEEATDNEAVAEVSNEYHSVKTPSFKEAVDSFIEDVVEIGSKLGFITEQKPQDQLADNPETANVAKFEEISTTSANPLDNSTEQLQQKSEIALNEEPQPITTEGSFTSYQAESTSESPVLKETIDSFINQVSEIGSNLGKTAEEVIAHDSMINTVTENSAETVTSLVHENDSETDQLSTQNSENNTERVPTFKQAVDAFIEDVVEIGSKLGLVPEQTAAAEQVPVSSENESINLESKNDSKVKTEDIGVTFKTNVEHSLDSLVGKLDEIATNLAANKSEDKSEEIVTTTPASLDNLEENQTNIPEVNDNTENSNFARSAETLIEAASEIGNNFGQVVSNLFAASDKQEIVTEIPNESSTESSTETTTQEEQNKSENLQILSEDSSTNTPIENIQEISLKSHEIEQENIEVSSTTQNNEEFSLKSWTESQEFENLKTQENENLTQNAKENISEQNPEEAKPKQVEQSAQFVEYIPVAVITIPEDELKTQQSLNPVQHETVTSISETKSNTEEIQLSTESKTTSEEILLKSDTVVKEESQSSQTDETLQENKQPESSESPHQDDVITTEPTIEKETTFKINDNLNESSTPAIIKTEEYTTSSPIVQEPTTPTYSINEETTIPAHAAIEETSTPAHAAIEETTTALNKFENTLKTLIEQEKLKKQEKHSNTLETSQQETTTLTPNSRSFTTVKEETNTLLTQDETTMLPKKFEEELQMAVKALEETTHHHFEEFQNNLKEAFKKFTVWGADHERQGEATTYKSSQSETTTEAATTPQSINEQISTVKNEEETTLDTNNNKEEEETSVNEEPHRIGVINQNFVDKFADNYQENSDVTTTEVQKEFESSSQLSALQETELKKQETTERIFTLTTMSTLEDDEEEKVKRSQEEQHKEIEATASTEVTTLLNHLEENSTPTSENIVQENTEESAAEVTAETTIAPLLARVPLQKDINSVSLTTVEEAATETLAQEPATQYHESQHLKETHTELTHTQTTQPTQRIQETITLSSPESFQQEMVTFIENDDTTTVKQEQTTKEVEENAASTTQTQEPLTQAAFMEEQQQQIESTTEHEAQTQTAAASGHTTGTTANSEDDTTFAQQQQYQEQTTETEIYSTTVVEKEVEEAEETTMMPIAATTAAAVEPEARSRALPPPKLEYLQNEDGVEIFYGYSIVKHN